MAHVRQQIREAAAAALAGVSQIGGRIFESRLYPLQDADLPCVLVSTVGEEIAPETVKTIVRRGVKLAVIIKAKTTTDFDDLVDAICVEVETDLAAAAGASLRNLELVEVDIDFDESDQPIGTAVLSYVVTVFTNVNDPETLL